MAFVRSGPPPDPVYNVQCEKWTTQFTAFTVRNEPVDCAVHIVHSGDGQERCCGGIYAYIPPPSSLVLPKPAEVRSDRDPGVGGGGGCVCVCSGCMCVCVCVCV